MATSPGELTIATTTPRAGSGPASCPGHLGVLKRTSRSHWHQVVRHGRSVVANGKENAECSATGGGVTLISTSLARTSRQLRGARIRTHTMGAGGEAAENATAPASVHLTSEASSLDSGTISQLHNILGQEFLLSARRSLPA